MKLAEDSLTRTTTGMWVRRIAVAALLLAIVVALTVMARKFITEPSGAKRQVAKISLLPDSAPPPPPPPPKEEPRKEPPKADAKPVQVDQPKQQQTPPQDAPIKMEGAAGDGPSAFAAGSVTQDYKGGAPITGASAPAGGAADRANERLYAGTARQLLRDEIERHLQPDAGQLTATFAVWVEADGRIGRCQLQPSGDATRDAQMQTALDGVARSLRLPPPPAIAQPMRFRLTVRAQG